jgi:hypothetical protein
MKQDEVLVDEENAMWNNVLGFLSLELFGPEITKAIEQHTFRGFPVRKEEKVVNVELKDWEKRLFIITDAVLCYGENHQDDMTVYKAKAIVRISDALREIFWAILPLQHKEVRNKSFGIREGLKVVEVPKSKGLEGNPLEGLFKMFSPPKD